MTFTEPSTDKDTIVDFFTSFIQNLGTIAGIVLDFLKAFGVAG